MMPCFKNQKQNKTRKSRWEDLTVTSTIKWRFLSSDDVTWREITRKMLNFCRDILHIKCLMGVRREGPVVNSTDCSPRGLQFSSQHPCWASHKHLLGWLSQQVPSSSSDPVPSSGLLGYLRPVPCSCPSHRYICFKKQDKTKAWLVLYKLSGISFILLNFNF